MKKLIQYSLIMLIGVVILCAVVLFNFYKHFANGLPDVSELKHVQLQQPMEVYSNDNKLIAIFGEHRRIPLSYTEIPPQLINAVIATEDTRFFEHHGIDPIGITRALFVALTSGAVSQGASTITQQVAKNFFLTPEKKISRKVKEIILAMRIESVLSKTEILELYLNKIYLGSRAYGMGAAAYTYFGKTINELTLSEIATLAGLPKAPSTYNPITSKNKAVARRNWVLHRMLTEKFITEEEYKTAINEPLEAEYHDPKVDFSAPYIAEMARQQLYDALGEETYQGGYKVYTTITKELQQAATTAVERNILNYDIRHGYRGPTDVLWKPGAKPFSKEQIQQTLKKYSIIASLIPGVVTKVANNQAFITFKNGSQITINYDGVRWARKFISDERQGVSPRRVENVLQEGQLIWTRMVNGQWWLAQIPEVNSAMVSLNSDNGAILALVGGFSFQLSNFNRATQSIRQVGSNIKPFIYAAGFSKGMTLATILNDAPITRLVGKDLWSPKNSPNVYEGPLRLRVGIGLSKNVMMVRAMRAIGVDYAADYLERFGFPENNISRTESLALGSASFTPLQLVRGYSVFNNGGFLVTPYFITRIENLNGEVIYQANPSIACPECNIATIYKDEPQKNAIALENTENETAPVGDSQPDLNKLIAENSYETANINAANPAPLKHYAPHVIDEGVAFLVQDALKSNIWGEPNQRWLPTGWRARVLKRKDIGGKTGTTNASKDAWFSGFGNNIVSSIWIGFDNHQRSLGRGRREALNPASGTFGEDGSKAAMPAWLDFMKAALQGLPEKKYTVPQNIVKISIDKTSGYPSKGGNSMMEYFIKGTESKQQPIIRSTTTTVAPKVVASDGSVSELF